MTVNSETKKNRPYLRCEFYGEPYHGVAYGTVGLVYMLIKAVYAVPSMQGVQELMGKHAQFFRDLKDQNKQVDGTSAYFERFRGVKHIFTSQAGKSWDSSKIEGRRVSPLLPQTGPSF